MNLLKFQLNLPRNYIHIHVPWGRASTMPHTENCPALDYEAVMSTIVTDMVVQQLCMIMVRSGDVYWALLQVFKPRTCLLWLIFMYSKWVHSSDLQHSPLYHVYEHTVSGQCNLNLVMLANTCIIIVICINELWVNLIMLWKTKSKSVLKSKIIHFSFVWMSISTQY